MKNYTTEDIEKELISKLSGKKTYATAVDINRVLFEFLDYSFRVKNSYLTKYRTLVVLYKDRPCFNIKFKTTKKGIYNEVYFTDTFNVYFNQKNLTLKEICEEIDNQIIEENFEKQKFNSYVTQIGFNIIKNNKISNKYNFIKIIERLNSLSSNIWEDYKLNK